MSGRKWTDAELHFLKVVYPHTGTKGIAAALKRSEKSVYLAAWIAGFRKSAAYLHSEECGRLYKGHKRGDMHKFIKGQVAWNKGKKRAEWMSPEGIRIMKKTQFKKGNTPPQNTFDGNIVVHSNGFRYIRLAKAKWKAVHVYNWEQVHGPVPKGFIVAFKDRDVTNCDISNLQLLSRAQNMLRNSGSLHLSDGLVAFYLAGKNKKHLIPEFKKHPELLELKRNNILLKRNIKSQQLQKTA